LFVEWAQTDTANAFVDGGETKPMAALYVFLIYTPFLVLFAWLLEWAVDTPSKNFAGEIDLEARLEKARVKPGEEEKPKKDFCEFICGSWKFWCIVGWFAGVFIITELYQAARTPRDGEDPDAFSVTPYYPEDDTPKEEDK